MPINQTCLQSVIPNYSVMVNNNYEQSSGNEIYNIAAGENKHPVSFMTDKQWEELAFPVLFPKGRYGYTAKRKIMLLIPVKYFNAQLLHLLWKICCKPRVSVFCTIYNRAEKSFRLYQYCIKKGSWSFCNCCSIMIQSTRLTKSNLSRPSLFIFETNSRYSTLLAKMYVRGSCYGETTWYSKMVYDAFLC